MLKIAVLSGGYSSEAKVSVKSARTVMDELPSDTYVVTEVRIDKDRWYALKEGEECDIDRSNFSFTYKGELNRFDCVFIMVHGTPGEDGRLQGYFDLLGMPYTTCSQFISSLTFNKWACNILLKQLGFSSAKSMIFRKGDKYNPEIVVSQLGLPCFIKPNDGGSSFGVTKVKEENQVSEAIENAFKEGTEVLCESSLNGREVTVGVYQLNGEIKVLPVTEIISEAEYFDWAAKYEGASQEITPADLETSIYEEVQRVTGEIYSALGMKGIARIDYIIQDGTPFVIEINTVPGMSQASIIPQQVRCEGGTLDVFFSQLISEAIKAKS